MSTENKDKLGKNKILWMILFIIIAVATIWTIGSQSKDFSINMLVKYIFSINPLWIVIAIIAVIGFAFFEGFAITIMGKEYGHKISIKDGFVYAASDIYFSAITPSATGGQPACAYFMVKDGLPLSFTTMALLINLMMYTASLTIIGIITVIICPGIFFKFGMLSKCLIGIGCVIQVVLILLFILLLFDDTLVEKLLNGAINFLYKIKIVRNPEKRINKYKKSIECYKECIHELKNKKGLLLKVFLCNVGQRISQMIVPAIIYFGTHGDLQLAVMIWYVQTLVTLGSYVIPIPGAMGITDYLMIDGFAGIIPHALATNLEIVSRGLSFYICIIICGITTLIKYILVQRRK